MGFATVNMIGPKTEQREQKEKKKEPIDYILEGLQVAQGITTQEALAFRGLGANVSNAWNLGNTANNTATDFSNGITNRISDPDVGGYSFQQGLDSTSNGLVNGEMQINNSSINTISDPLANIGNA